MATVTGFTAERAQLIEDNAIVSATINPSGKLILTKGDGSTVDAGTAKGPAGPTGPTGDVSSSQLTAATAAPGCKVLYTAGVLTMSPSTEYTINFTGTEERDTNNYHASGSSQIVVPTGFGGWYDIKATIDVTTGTSGFWVVMDLLKNGSFLQRLDRKDTGSTGSNMTLSGATEVTLDDADYLQLRVQHNAGSDRTLSKAIMSIHRIALA